MSLQSPLSCNRVSLVTVAAAALTIAAPVTATAAVEKPRLKYGPQVYRLKPTGERFGSIERSSYWYAIVYMPTKSVIGETFRGEGQRSAGDFSIAGVYAPNYTQDQLYLEPFGPKRCTVAYINRDDSDITARDMRKLERIKIGGRVRVTIRPLASALPDVSYGRTYHRTVRLRQGGKYELTEKAVQRQLRSIHCNRR